MSLYDFAGAFFSNPGPQSEFERLRREAREEIHRGPDLDAIYEAMNWGPQYMKPVWHEEPLNNHLKEKTIYHQGGSQTVFRNYAIVVTDGRTWKAPIMTPEGKLVQIGS